MNNLMYTFEVTKCCGYSNFITMYKNETLCHLYSRILEHFNLKSLKEVYFYPCNGCRVKIPLSNKSINAFVKENILCDPVKLVKLEPIYQLPNPVVYRLYIDEDMNCEGHCASNQCSSSNCIKNQTG